ncbi:hypothetical protein [Effusibacillus consociatus]|uniref:Uncharacterized protein n=1 Tax=Effusibacillus consociatus TaxID=1117041 RepID=A0ABV9Q3F9_9BACL
MQLVVLCTVCNEPWFVPSEFESIMLESHGMICKTCSQYSGFPHRLKEDIKKAAAESSLRKSSEL